MDNDKRLDNDKRRRHRTISFYTIGAFLLIGGAANTHWPTICMGTLWLILGSIERVIMVIASDDR